MEGHYWILLAAGVLTILAVGLIWRPVRSHLRETHFAIVRRDFHYQRERLEAKFVRLGLSIHPSSSPRWTDCQFDDDVSYARSRSTGQLSAFVAVAVMINDETDVPGLGTSRVATAVFRFDRDHWETDGQAIFNLTPTEAIRYFQGDLEMVAQELAHRS